MRSLLMRSLLQDAVDSVGASLVAPPPGPDSFSLAAAADTTRSALEPAVAAGAPLWRPLLVVAIGLPLLGWLTLWGRSVVSRRVGPHRGLITGKLIFYPGVVVMATLVLRELGFSLTPMLGAAGVVGIALGFASQTSVSNIVAGFFLVGERPFVVGDIIEIGSTAGTVLSVGMLSVKLRTWDNRFIRVPNESLMKSEVTNLTRFPIRRVDIVVRISYDEDLDHVQEVLLDAARAHPSSLMEPEPRLFFVSFGETAIHVKLTVWGTRDDRRELKHSLPALMKRHLDQAGIRIPHLPAVVPLTVAPSGSEGFG
ncbi:MAG: mechanosensitive ion channel family protein [Gemmatimonadota bacterium]